MHFIAFFCLTALARTSRTILSTDGESGHPYLVLNLRGKAFNFLLLSIIAVSLSYMTFIMLSYVTSVPSMVRNFIMKECCTLSTGFSVSIEMIMWLLSFILLV